MIDTKKKIKDIITWLEDYKSKTNCTGVVLGSSGGKDSTVVAMLAKKVWGNNVLAVAIPNGYQKDISDTINIFKRLHLNFKIVNIEKVYDDLLESIGLTSAYYFASDSVLIPNCSKITDKAKTNIAPRLRMTTLYAIAQTVGYRVIGTGNLSESYIGWTTKFGDNACDLNPIAHLTCSEVIEVGKVLAKEFNLDEKYIVKDPSDGLTGKTDEDNFGFTYEDLDQFIAEGLPGEKAETAEKIRKMHTASEHKRHMPYTIK